MKFRLELLAKYDVGQFECSVDIEARSIVDAAYQYYEMLNNRKLKWEPKTIYSDEISSFTITLSE